MTYREYINKWEELSQRQYTLRENFVREYNEKYKEFLDKKVEVFEEGRSKGIGYFRGLEVRYHDSFSLDVRLNKVRKDGSMALTSAGIYVWDIDNMELKLVEE